MPYIAQEDYDKIYAHAVSMNSGETETSNDWFTPYSGTRSLYRYLTIAVSAARCARVSYHNFEGKETTIEEDLALFQKIIVDQPVHASPVEHQATPDWRSFETGKWINSKRHGNLIGWQQARKFVPNENLEKSVLP